MFKFTARQNDSKYIYIYMLSVLALETLVELSFELMFGLFICLCCCLFLTSYMNLESAVKSIYIRICRTWCYNSAANTLSA